MENCVINRVFSLKQASESICGISSNVMQRNVQGENWSDLAI